MATSPAACAQEANNTIDTRDQSMQGCCESKTRTGLVQIWSKGCVGLQLVLFVSVAIPQPTSCLRCAMSCAGCSI